MFQVPKLEVLNLIRLFWGWVFPHISLTYRLIYRWVPPFLGTWNLWWSNHFNRSIALLSTVFFHAKSVLLNEQNLMTIIFHPRSHRNLKIDRPVPQWWVSLTHRHQTPQRNLTHVWWKIFPVVFCRENSAWLRSQWIPWPASRTRVLQHSHPCEQLPNPSFARSGPKDRKLLRPDNETD